MEREMPEFVFEWGRIVKIAPRQAKFLPNYHSRIENDPERTSP